MRKHWTLDPEICYLNHGSYGACPKVVQERQTALRAQMESEPVRFMGRELPGLVETARARLATLLHCERKELALIRNATTGVNAALLSFPLHAGDEVIVTDHEYNACRNALDRRAADTGASVRLVKLPFPVRHEDDIVECILTAVGPRTRLLLIDHVTSPTALVLPVHRLVPALREKGVECIVDGAHAPGMVPLDLEALGAAFYTGNCHKWLCAPKGTAFLRVREDFINRARPPVTSHGMNQSSGDKSRFLLEFDWTGTDDYTGWCTLPTALDFMAGLVPGGIDGLMAANRQKAIAARKLLNEGLGVEPVAPESLLGSLAAVRVPDSDQGCVPGAFDVEPLGERLFTEHKIEVPVVVFPNAPQRLVRISAQAYNTMNDYERLSRALKTIFA
ncbi:MAG: aminotransferase class V-fold PLP-dependent enzyme [Planctomycetes bacterium]|nr:aminotransferase class V-fold PLP-dependent enzyme [Planctomycetota bacterium]